MEALLDNLLQLVSAGWGVVYSLGRLMLPWAPLFAWVAYWLFAVNWDKLWDVLLGGGWIGLVLIALIAVLVWGMVAPPESGVHHLLGLSLSNFFGKLVFVTSLVCIMLLCGSVQMAGCCAPIVTLAKTSEPCETPSQHAVH